MTMKAQDARGWHKLYLQKGNGICTMYVVLRRSTRWLPRGGARLVEVVVVARLGGRILG